VLLLLLLLLLLPLLLGQQGQEEGMHQAVSVPPMLSYCSAARLERCSAARFFDALAAASAGTASLSAPAQLLWS